MSAITCRVPFHGEWSGNKFADRYFRKLTRIFWKHVSQIVPKERLKHDYLPTHFKEREDILHGRLDKKVRIDGFERLVNIIYINPRGKDANGWQDPGSIIVHELLHWLDSQVKESIVSHREEMLWHEFTGDQRNYFYVCMFAKLIQPDRGIRIKVTVPRKSRKRRE
ncbi:MAG: hypothetical protein G01um101429_288 [Parcubacteria group bacterium Gr01-1014_29]|nr:MAG: hypothetical protein G01um101429_288 [Parcubacteria group bacterium Gr01-1014_29]